jgi:hypothetical protein
VAPPVGVVPDDREVQVWRGLRPASIPSRPPRSESDSRHVLATRPSFWRLDTGEWVLSPVTIPQRPPRLLTRSDPYRSSGDGSPRTQYSETSAELAQDIGGFEEQLASPLDER